MSDDIRIIEGNTKSFTITVLDGQEPLNLTSAIVYLTVKAVGTQGTVEAVDASAIILKTSPATGIVITDPAQGKITVTFNPSDTRNRGSHIPYKYDLRIKLASGAQHSTQVANFHIEDAVRFDDIP